MRTQFPCPPPVSLPPAKAWRVNSRREALGRHQVCLRELPRLRWAFVLAHAGWPPFPLETSGAAFSRQPRDLTSVLFCTR